MWIDFLKNDFWWSFFKYLIPSKLLYDSLKKIIDQDDSEISFTEKYYFDYLIMLLYASVVYILNVFIDNRINHKYKGEDLQEETI